MTRVYLLGFVGVLAGVLAGCPIFPDNGHGGSGPCVGAQCTSGCLSSADCGQNETCGSDNQCHPGDCTFSGCSTGYHCVVDPTSNTASCQPGGGTGGSGGSGTGGSTTGTGGTGGTTTSPPVYCGHPADCGMGQICNSDGTCHPGPCGASNPCIYGYTCQSDGTCGSSTANACNSDSDCSMGSLCLAGGDGKGGVCTTPANQCFDGSQCGPGEVCASGKCILSCTSNSQCRDGYTCDTNHGICSVPAQPCTLTNDCKSATLVCVGGACVPRSNMGMCPTPGDVWTENGCIPGQAATFVCATDGQMGSGMGVVGQTCAAGSICLHHDCWISCDPSTMMPCNTPNSQFPLCKPVVENGTTYNVCGSASNLGTQCGPNSPNNASCNAPSICIDGNCM